MPLNQANADLMIAMAEMGVPPVSESTPDEVRALMEAMRAIGPPGPDMARIDDYTVATADGASITIRVVVPDGEIKGVIVYYHGGGWVIGSIESHDPIVRTIASATGYAVANVGYRLAPEFPFPTPVDDATTAFHWVAENLVGSSTPPTPPPTFRSW